jgi:hypothetical protein
MSVLLHINPLKEMSCFSFPIVGGVKLRRTLAHTSLKIEDYEKNDTIDAG